MAALGSDYLHNHFDPRKPVGFETVTTNHSILFHDEFWMVSPVLAGCVFHYRDQNHFPDRHHLFSYESAGRDFEDFNGNGVQESRRNKIVTPGRAKMQLYCFLAMKQIGMVLLISLHRKCLIAGMHKINGVFTR